MSEERRLHVDTWRDVGGDMNGRYCTRRGAGGDGRDRKRVSGTRVCELPACRAPYWHRASCCGKVSRVKAVAMGVGVSGHAHMTMGT